MFILFFGLFATFISVACQGKHQLEYLNELLTRGIKLQHVLFALDVNPVKPDVKL